jgi:hypothetical protein
MIMLVYFVHYSAVIIRKIVIPHWINRLVLLLPLQPSEKMEKYTEKIEEY